MSFTAAVWLLFPGSFLEPMWRLNPSARQGFEGMGSWAILLMSVVSIGCGAAAVGLWRARRWGYHLAMIILAINVIGDTANGFFGNDRRVLIGVPIGGALFAYLLFAKKKREIA